MHALVGGLARLGGTLFVTRGSARDVAAVQGQIRRAWLHHALPIRIDEGELPGVEGEGHRACLARLQQDSFHSLEGSDRDRGRGFQIGEVELHHLLPCHGPRIPELHREPDFLSCLDGGR